MAHTKAEVESSVAEVAAHEPTGPPTAEQPTT